MSLACPHGNTISIRVQIFTLCYLYIPLSYACLSRDFVVFVLSTNKTFKRNTKNQVKVFLGQGKINGDGEVSVISHKCNKACMELCLLQHSREEGKSVFLIGEGNKVYPGYFFTCPNIPYGCLQKKDLS